MSNFFDRVDHFDPAAVGIAILAMIVMVGATYAVCFWHESRELDRETRRRRVGYVHRIRRVELPHQWPPAAYRDTWAPGSQERNGRAGPEVGYQDQVAKNAERHRRSLP